MKKHFGHSGMWTNIGMMTGMLIGLVFDYFVLGIIIGSCVGYATDALLANRQSDEVSSKGNRG